MYKIDQEEPQQVCSGFEQVQASSIAVYLRTNDPQKAAAPRRAAIYARTALSQEPEGENFALMDQIRRCKQHCQERGYTIDERYVYSETGRGSADAREHQQFASLYKAAQRHEFDTVVLTSLDRLSRNQACSTALLDEFAQFGITVECVDGDTAVLLLQLAQYAAEMGRAKIAERSAHGKKVKKAKHEQQ